MRRNVGSVLHTNPVFYSKSDHMTPQANPYRPPASNVSQADNQHDAEPAGKGRRFGTFVVDYVCFMALAFVVGFVAVLVFGQAGADAIDGIPDIMLGTLIMFSYYTFFEGIWARTPGKLVFGTVVVTDKGSKPSLGTVIKRTLCRFIPFEPLSFFGPRGWHDGISATRVVRKRRV